MSDSEKGIWNGKTFKDKYGKLIREMKIITTQYFQNEKIEKILKVIKKELENPITSYTILKRKK